MRLSLDGLVYGHMMQLEIDRWAAEYYGSDVYVKNLAVTGSLLPQNRQTVTNLVTHEMGNTLSPNLPVWLVAKNCRRLSNAKR